MCILFFHAKKLNLPGKFRVIIVSNRDEFYARPALPAHFWKEHCNVFGGRDQQTGDEGGTWLAINKQGRLATLLNITSALRETTARSRGHLVTDFVTSQVPGPQFQAQVVQEALQHNPFHLLTMEILPEDVRVLYVARQPNGEVLGPEELSPTLDTPLTASLSNSPLHNPFRKAKEGAEIFQDIIDRFDSTDRKEELISKLMAFAKTNTRFYPDPVLTQYREVSPLTERFSSIFVEVPEIGYGTRTHTIILVDQAGQVDVVESTLIPGASGEWKPTRESFTLQNSSS